MNPKSSSVVDGRYTLSEKTSQTDDQRIKDLTPLPPPEHLIRFFPMRGDARSFDEAFLPAIRARP